MRLLEAQRAGHIRPRRATSDRGPREPTGDSVELVDGGPDFGERSEGLVVGRGVGGDARHGSAFAALELCLDEPPEVGRDGRAAGKSGLAEHEPPIVVDRDPGDLVSARHSGLRCYMSHSGASVCGGCRGGSAQASGARTGDRAESRCAVASGAPFGALRQLHSQFPGKPFVVGEWGIDNHHDDPGYVAAMKGFWRVPGVKMAIYNQGNSTGSAKRLLSRLDHRLDRAGLSGSVCSGDGG